MSTFDLEVSLSLSVALSLSVSERKIDCESEWEGGRRGKKYNFKSRIVESLNMFHSLRQQGVCEPIEDAF